MYPPPPKSPVASSTGMRRGHERSPKTKNPLDANLKQPTAGRPKARGRPPKKARTTKIEMMLVLNAQIFVSHQLLTLLIYPLMKIV
jgi:hypothetical protein